VQLSGTVNITSPNSRVYSYFPSYYLISGDATHHLYGNPPNYPTIGDYRIFHIGIGSFPLLYAASAQACTTVQYPDPGSHSNATLTLAYPPNTIVVPSSGASSGPIDFNNLPSFSVGSTTGGCGTSGYTFGITDGALPTGMSLDSSTGILSGAPTVGGPYAFSVYAEKKSISTYCWGKVDYAGVVIVGSGGLLFAGTSNGPLYINSIPQWQIHRFDLRQRPEQKS
jgi:hypothetical protein